MTYLIEVYDSNSGPTPLQGDRDMRVCRRLQWSRPTTSSTPPDPRCPFVGLQLTDTVTGRRRVGPTTIPSLLREDYEELIHHISDADHLPKTPIRAKPTSRRYGTPQRPAAEVLVTASRPASSRRSPFGQAGFLRTRGCAGVQAPLHRVPSGKRALDFVVRSDGRSTQILHAAFPRGREPSPSGTMWSTEF